MKDFFSLMKTVILAGCVSVCVRQGCFPMEIVFVTMGASYLHTNARSA